MHELTNRPLRDAERVRHLLLAAALHCDLQQRLALAFGERGEARQRLPHDGAPLHLLLGRLAAPQRLLQLRVVVAPDPQLIQSRVVDDPVQPGAQIAHLVASLQSAPGLEIRVLQRILGPRVR